MEIMYKIVLIVSRNKITEKWLAYKLKMVEEKNYPTYGIKLILN